MEIGSVAHKYYLINIRLPVNERKGINVGIGEIKDIRLVVSVCLASVCDFCPGAAATPFLISFLIHSKVLLFITRSSCPQLCLDGWT